MAISVLADIANPAYPSANIRFTPCFSAHNFGKSS